MYFCLVFMLLAFVGCNGAEESCFTISRTEGYCVIIYDCPDLFDLLKQPRPSPAERINTMRRSQCGSVQRTPKVCCPYNDQPMSTLPRRFNSLENGMQFPNVMNHPNLHLLNYSICGPYTGSRIINGNETDLLEFPWMALLSYNVSGSESEYKCGGTLISKRYVLTAAHCVAGLSTEIIVKGVRLGEHDLSTERDCVTRKKGKRFCSDGYRDFLAETVHVHANFSINKHQNDIALIRLNKDAIFRDNVKPICLPIGSTAPLLQKEVTITGWGVTESKKRSNVLLQTKVPIVSNNECSQAYKSDRIEISYKQLCAGGKNSTDSCTGDSGGPMQVPIAYENLVKYFQYGVISFGLKDCMAGGLPSVYTNVAYYVDWILDHMAD